MTAIEHWARRNADELNKYRELQRIDRTRAISLMKKVDERLSLARSQFKKRSFRVSFQEDHSVEGWVSVS